MHTPPRPTYPPLLLRLLPFFLLLLLLALATGVAAQAIEDAGGLEPDELFQADDLPAISALSAASADATAARAEREAAAAGGYGLAAYQLLSPIHFVWFMPLANARDHSNHFRTLDARALTGCCDAFLALALSTALLHNSHADVWCVPPCPGPVPQPTTPFPPAPPYSRLWTDANWTKHDVSTRLLDHPRLSLHHFNASELAAPWPPIQEAFSLNDSRMEVWRMRTFLQADMARYLLLYHYGGSYFDADCSFRQAWAYCAQRHRLPVSRPIFNIDKWWDAGGMAYESYALGVAQLPNHPNFLFSNGLLANVPRHYWLFKYLLDAIATTHKHVVGTKVFNVFGPR